MYQALYRKWRPRTFDEVVGQEHVTATLKNELITGRLSHAYLFTGSRGTGKTSCAKLLARAVNCEHPVDGNPCNDCMSCIGIENGSIPDVVELDAASNNGVDNVRALRDEAIFTPAAVKKRVYIIDEVHMLSTSAFNALLKIMEEPPDHLIFILATTEVHKIPATILSRCQRFSFKRVSPQSIMQRLNFVAVQEKIDLTQEAAMQLARLADGSLRDALSLLDQCAATEDKIDTHLVDTLLGFSGTARTMDLIKAIVGRDTAAALKMFDDVYTAGKDIAVVMDELGSLMRDLMVIKTAPKSGLGLLSGISADLEPIANELGMARLIYGLNLISETQSKLQRSQNRRIDAELCIVALCDEQVMDTPDAVLARLERLENERMNLPDTANKPPTVHRKLEQSENYKITAQEAEDANKASAVNNWPEVLKKLKGTLAPPEIACLSNQDLVQLQEDEGTLVLSYKDEVTGRTINREHVKIQISNVLGGKTVRIVQAAPSKQAVEDKFEALISLKEKFNNIELK